MLVSTSVRDNATGLVLASDTRLEMFRGEMHLNAQLPDLGNLLGNMVLVGGPELAYPNSSWGETVKRRLLSVPADGEAFLVVPEGYQWGDQPSYVRTDTIETGMATRILAAQKSGRRSVGTNQDGELYLSTDRAPAVPAGMVVSIPYSLRTMFFSLNADAVYVIGGTEPLEVGEDGHYILRSIYRLSTALNPPGWTLAFDGGQLASSILQIQACSAFGHGQLYVQCVYTSRQASALQMMMLSYAEGTLRLENAWATSVPLKSRRFYTEYIEIHGSSEVSPDLVLMVPLANQQQDCCCNRILRVNASQGSPNPFDVLEGAPVGCFVSMASLQTQSAALRLFAVDEGQNMWSWVHDGISTPSGFSRNPVFLPMASGGSAFWKMMLWADNNRLVVAGSQSIKLWTQCSPCPAGTTTANVSSPETDVHARCLCAPGTFSTTVNFKRVCAQCTQPSNASRCVGGHYRTLMDPVCPGLGSTSDQGCAPCTTQKDCPPKRLAVGTPCTGEGTNNTMSCQTCPNPCVAGVSFVSNDCSLDKYSVCTSCRDTCGAHKYISRECTIEDDAQCRQCRLVCPAGQYMQRTCRGDERQDASACQNCSSIASCPESDQFVNLRDCALGNITLLTKDKVCQRCATCPPGTWESKPCTLFSDRVCTPCTRCQAFEDTGTYEVKACGSTWDAVCANCTRCKPVSSIYNASNASEVGYPRWKRGARRGEYIYSSCGDGSDTVCGKCQVSWSLLTDVCCHLMKPSLCAR